jgi:hypothetical protein
MKKIMIGWASRATFAALIVVGAIFLPIAARAQNPRPVPMMMNCRQIWDDAASEAARAALARANRDAGAPQGAASAWATAWTQAWINSWKSAGAALKPDANGDCCRVDWFEMAVMAGKSSWEQAWRTAPHMNGPAEAWAEKFSAAYADEWANVWFLYYPWLCAKAKVNAAVTATAQANASAKAGAYAWAFGFALAGAFATSWEDSFSVAWSESSSRAWAATGAEALARVQANASAWAAAGVSGDCAIARAGACADAAAAAFAAAWADAGASAFANAYAYAWADAYAAAFANAWAQAQASAGGVALASAASKAFAQAVADSYAAVWRVKLRDHAQIPMVVAWWTKPGAPMPNLKKIWLLLAREQMSTMKTVFANALKNAQSGQTAWDFAFRKAADQAAKEASIDAETWVYSWSNAWAYSWAEAWVEAYKVICARASAAVCKTCPCTTTTPGTTGERQPGTTGERTPTPGTTGERPRTVGKPTGFSYVLIGLGVNSGTVFRILVTNQTGESFVVEIPAGTVFSPDNPEVQRVVIDKTSNVQAPANGTSEAPLTGYCLDYGKQPPPPTNRGARQTEAPLVAAVDPAAVLAALQQWPTVNYRVDENAGAYAPVLKIIEAGNQLAAQGKFHNDMPPDKYKLAVIQRAIWTYTSRGTAKPHTRDSLLADIKRQVKETGGDQTDAQINELVNHLMDDVTAVLRGAGVQ